MTPLIFAGPPLILATGEVGVFGEGLEIIGDLGIGLVASLVGGGLMGCVDLVACRVVGGGGPGLPSVFMFLIILAAFAVPFSLEGESRLGFCSLPEDRASPRFFAFEVSELVLGVFEGVSAKAEPLSILPSPPSRVPFVDEGALP